MQRIPLVLAVVFIVVRIILEESGVAAGAAVILGVNWLYFLVPIYFAIQVTGDHPYKALFKQVLIFAVITRLMIMVTYWLAYQFHWGAERFRSVLDAAATLPGVLLATLGGLVFGTVISVLIGMIVGSISLAIRRRVA